MNKVLRIALTLCLLVVASNVFGQAAPPSPTWVAKDVKGNAGRILSVIYGAQIVGCTQTDVTTSGNNRSGPYLINRMYVIYGYDNTTKAGDTLTCIMGGSGVDVNSIAGGKVGKKIYANQQEVWTFLNSSNLFISCISANATKKYDVCEITY
jgi:hypothetical protein